MSSRSKPWCRISRAPVAALLACLGCATGSPSVSSSPVSTQAPAVKPSAPRAEEVVGRLAARYGEAQRARLDRGVTQVAALWREEEGDLEAFVSEYFLTDPAQLDATFARLEQALEQLDGHLLGATADAFTGRGTPVLSSTNSGTSSRSARTRASVA